MRLPLTLHASTVQERHKIYVLGTHMAIRVPIMQQLLHPSLQKGSCTLFTLRAEALFPFHKSN